MSSEYRLAAFKGFVTFVFVGVIGFLIEGWYSASQSARDQKRVLWETSYDHLANFGTLVGVIALSVAGVLSLAQLVFAASLSPVVPIALLTARPLTSRFERRAIKPWALGLASLSALVLLVRTL